MVFYADDIDNQTNTSNYVYDQIGNLTKDVKENITLIKWNVYGKITEIQRPFSAANPVTNIQYTYDAAGNRISKRVQKNGTTTIEHTWYVRDASGNVMSVYNSTGTTAAVTSAYTLNLTEQHMYGSSRLGIINRNISIKTTFVKPAVVNFTRGNKFFELSNHLGNVLVTVSDKKIGIDQNTDGTIDYYTADVITANDYYPFGSQMPGRKYSQANTKYRYGFNGKENDNDVKGEGNQLDYGARMLDTRLGRFLSVDPLAKQFAYYSPYQSTGNSPIRFIDLDGQEPTSPPEFLKNIRLAHDLDKGNTVNGYFDPNDRLHYMSVEKIYDETQKQAFFIHKDNQGTASYWVSQESTLRVHRKADGSTQANGHWERYETYEQTQQKIRAAAPDVILAFLGGGAAVAVAAPVVIPYASAAAATYGTATLSFGLTERAVGVGINAGFQYLQNAPNKGWGIENLKNMNGTSLFLTGLNPEAVAVNAIGSNFGKLTIADRGSKSVLGSGFNLREASVGAAIDFTGGKMGKGLENLALKYGGLKPLQSSTLGNVLSGTATTPANTINEEANKKTP